MRTILHIITRPDDVLARAIIARQTEKADCQVRVTDLTIGAPDYDELLVKIFEADSIAVW